MFFSLGCAKSQAECGTSRAPQKGPTYQLRQSSILLHLFTNKHFGSTSILCQQPTSSSHSGKCPTAGLARQEALRRSGAAAASGSERGSCAGAACSDHHVVSHLPALGLQCRWRHRQPRLPSNRLRAAALFGQLYNSIMQLSLNS